jgi:hypothetical protein
MSDQVAGGDIAGARVTREVVALAREPKSSPSALVPQLREQVTQLDVAVRRFGEIVTALSARAERMDAAQLLDEEFGKPSP